MARLYSVDRGGGGVSDRKERLADSTDLAPEGGAGVIAHFCMFFGLCFMEDAGPNG